MPEDPLPLDPDVGSGGDPLRYARNRLVAIAAGGGLGTLARHGLEESFPRAEGTFPWATFGIDVSGAFLLAILVVLVIDRWTPMEHVQPFACVGFCGGFTTFSTFMMQAVLLERDGDTGVGALYVISTVVAGVVAVLIGIRIARAFDRRFLT
jgi:fluoride exporter